MATALRAPRHPSSGIGAIVSSYASLARSDVAAAFLCRGGSAQLLAVGGPRVSAVGTLGAVDDELARAVLGHAPCSGGTGGQLPSAFDEFAHEEWACCPLTDDDAVVLLSASRGEPVLGLAEIVGPVAALAGIVNERRGAFDAREQLGRQRQEQSMVSAGLQHDLRVPLHTVLAAATTLRDRGDQLDEEQRKRMLTMIADQAERAAGLASDALSDVSGDAPVRRIRTHLGQLMWSVAESVRARRGGLVTLDVPSVEVETDPVRLERALANLLDNALKHGATAGPVSVHVEQRAGDLDITVADRGPGVNEAILPSLFGAFVTDPDDAGGTGLGLHSVQHIAQELGGRITYSRRDGWTRFRLTLPLNAPRRDAAPTEEMV